MNLIRNFLLFVLAIAPCRTFAQVDTTTWPGVLDPFQVITINLEMAPADWETVKADTSLSIEKQALMWADGETNKILVEVKRKSDPAIGPKVSLKLDINAFVAGQEWRGLRKLSLENGNGGNSVVREGFAHYMHRLAWQAGLYDYNPGFASWVKLNVNGEYIGVYVHAEERDKQFLKNRGMWKEGATWLYKNDPNPVLETGASGNSPTYSYLCFTPFRSACAQQNLEFNLPPRIDMGGMLTLGAIEAFMANGDGMFSHDGKNVFYVDFLATNHLKRLYLPWDLDAGMGGSSATEKILGFGGNYSSQILDHYWFRQWYLHIMTDLINGPLSSAALTDALNRIEPVLTPALLTDVNSGLDENPASEFASIRQWITNRIADVRGQVGTVIGWTHFNQNGGEIIPGFQLILSHTNASGSIYYTLNGTDPRGFSGAITGTLYSSPITLTGTTHIMARTRVGTNWSALRQATFNVAHALDALKITEIMYHPRPITVSEDGDEYEFIELKNTGGTALDLSGCSFDGINYKFRPGTTVAAGGFLTLVRNSLPFTNRYPAATIQGIYFGGLENSGEKLRLKNSDGNNVFSVEYDDDPQWPIGPDGFGYSLVNSSPSNDPDIAENWRASANANGSPGADDPAPAYGVGVVINEVLTHTDPPLEDAIELYNPTANPINIGGWFLSDQIDTSDPSGTLLKKFSIPAGTIVPAFGFKVVYESDFNANANPFGLSQYGDQVYLSSATGTNLTGYIVGAKFGAADNGRSFGRYQTSTGIDFTTLQSRSFGVDNPTTLEQFRTGTGLSNALPVVGPVVINEIMYNSTNGGTEFLELHNLTGASVDLAGWTLKGAGGFVFPSGSIIAANDFVVLIGTTNITPAQFRSTHQVPEAVPVLAHSFDLQNDGEALELGKPNDLPTNPPIVVDRVRYNDKAPWPTEADGAGPSLERFPSSAYGNEPLNWRTFRNGGSPGRENSLSSIIAIAQSSSWQVLDFGWNLGTPWMGTNYSNSGWLSADAVLGYGEPFVRTILTNGATTRPVTVYLRKKFVINDLPSSIGQLTFSANYDDGFVAYINGQEVARQSIAAGSVTNSTLASSHASGAYEVIDLTAHVSKLVHGANVLAVELHQDSTNSLDAIWDATLSYTVNAPVELHFTAVEYLSNGHLQLSLTGTGNYTIQASTNLLDWDPISSGVLNGTVQFTDTQASALDRRFYRAISP